MFYDVAPLLASVLLELELLEELPELFEFELLLEELPELFEFELLLEELPELFEFELLLEKLPEPLEFELFKFLSDFLEALDLFTLAGLELALAFSLALVPLVVSIPFVVFSAAVAPGVNILCSTIVT